MVHILDEFHIPNTSYLYRGVSDYAQSGSVYALERPPGVSVYALKILSSDRWAVDNLRQYLLLQVSRTM